MLKFKTLIISSIFLLLYLTSCSIPSQANLSIGGKAKSGQTSTNSISKGEESMDHSASNSVKKEKLSVEQMLKENNHLPIKERIALYHKLKKEKPDAYNFENEHELNKYGYSLLFGNKGSEAIEIFKLLVSEFPNSSNPYDSLGEAYIRNGNEEQSIANYEKSLKLDPKNNNARHQIELIKGNLDIFEADSTWGKEIFKMPLNFAPEINYKGIEDARFPKGWAKKDSPDFWSYAFAWNINFEGELRGKELETSLQLYFDGLMKGRVSRDKEMQMQNTVAKILKKEDSSDVIRYIGEINMLDAFITKKSITLNVSIEKYYCDQNKKTIVLFRFSPKEFGHDIWLKLKQLKLRADICDL